MCVRLFGKENFKRELLQRRMISGEGKKSTGNLFLFLRPFKWLQINNSSLNFAPPLCNLRKKNASGYACDERDESPKKNETFYAFSRNFANLLICVLNDRVLLLSHSFE